MDNNIFKHNTNMAKNALFVIYELKNLGLIMIVKIKKNLKFWKF